MCFEIRSDLGAFLGNKWNHRLKNVILWGHHSIWYLCMWLCTWLFSSAFAESWRTLWTIPEAEFKPAQMQGKGGNVGSRRQVGVGMEGSFKIFQGPIYLGFIRNKSALSALMPILKEQQSFCTDKDGDIREVLNENSSEHTLHQQLHSYPPTSQQIHA